MNTIESLFFQILRSALGVEKLTEPVSLSPRRWKRLYEISLSQNLSALILDELERTGSDIPRETLECWRAYSAFSRNRFDAQLMALTHLSGFLEGYGIRVMVLKGVGLSLLYPEPQNRECSDIDIFCFGEYDRVNGILIESGLIQGLDEENDKHCGFTFDGICIENHRQFSEWVNHANILIGKEIAVLSDKDNSSDSRLPGIFFPGPEMGALHLAMHTLSHLAWSGISVRHLLDFALYFNRHKAELDMEHIMDLWKEAGIENAAVALSVLAEELLGIDTGINFKKELLVPKDKESIFKSMMHPCLSSSGVRNPVTKLMRKYRQFRFRSTMHPLVYGETFPDSFWKSLSFLKSFRKSGR